MKKFLNFLTIIAFCFISTSYASPATLNFATEATYPPFESMDNSGQMQGFDVEIVKALCQQMQTQCTFTNQAWDSLIPGLQLKKFDGIFGAMNITKARQQQVDFTKPYYVNTGSLVAAKSAGLSLSPESLKGKTIGVQTGTTFAQYLQDKYGSDAVKVNTYASFESAFLDLTSGRIDAVMGDTPILTTWLKKNNNYVLVGQSFTDEEYFGQGYGIAVRKGNTDLLQQLNKALDAIKANGVYEKIVQQYFGVTK